MAAKKEKTPLTNKKFEKDLTTLEKKITKIMEESDGRFNQRMDQLLSYIGDVKRYLENEISAHSKLLEIGFETSIAAAERRLREQVEQHRDQILTRFDKFLKEILGAREERAAISIRLSDHEDRIQNLEAVAAVDKRPAASAK